MKRYERDKEASAFLQAYWILFASVVTVLCLWLIFIAIVFYLLGWFGMSYTYRFILGVVMATFVIGVVVQRVWKK